MLGNPQMGLKQLSVLSRRLATSLGAGIDVRTVFLREADAAQGSTQRKMRHIRDDVAMGSSIAEAFDHSGKLFPKFFRSMVEVGEQSGQLPEVFRRLADHYDHKIRLRRNLLSALAMPMIELVLALSVIGVLIYFMGAKDTLRKNNTDILGFGLTGARGLAIYLGILATIFVGCYVVYLASVRSRAWVAPVQIAIMKLPGIGRALETMSMANLCWALQITLNTGMDLGKAIDLSLASTRNAAYSRYSNQIIRRVRGGHEIHEALRETDAFPHLFVDAVQTGEESGNLVEMMGHLAGQYQEQSKSAATALTVALGILVLGLIGAIIIFFIFRVFGFYVNTINDLSKPGLR